MTSLRSGMPPRLCVFLYCLVYAHCVVAAPVALTEVPIKIVKAKPVPKAATHGTVAGAVPAPVPRRPPALFAGPELFLPLAARCWAITSKGYEYKLCPYHNVTQKDVGRAHNAFHGILGIWQGWKVDGDKYSAQVYTNGTDCPNKKQRRTEVEIKCSEGDDVTITAVEEPVVCEYLMSISCPQGCGWDRTVATPTPSPVPPASLVPAPPGTIGCDVSGAPAHAVQDAPPPDSTLGPAQTALQGHVQVDAASEVRASASESESILSHSSVGAAPATGSAAGPGVGEHRAAAAAEALAVASEFVARAKAAKEAAGEVVDDAAIDAALDGIRKTIQGRFTTH